MELVNTKSTEETICEEHFGRLHFRNKNGRYVVTIPLREEPLCLGKSRDIAFRRLNSLWCKLDKDTNYNKLYKNFIEEYENLGHMTEISNDEEKQFPLAAPMIRENFYMDDGLCGAPTLEEAKELKRELIGILARAGMTLHKWSANHPELTSNENENDEFSNSDEVKTLGVMWRPSKNCFAFQIEVDVHSVHTKRSVLSVIARTFDPLGLLGPVIAKA